MLYAAPESLLQVNRGPNIDMLNDLLRFMSNEIFKRGMQIFGIGNLQNSIYQGGMSEQKSRMLNTWKQWATGILLGSP